MRPQIGDILTYRIGDEKRTIRVTRIETNIKNGRPGFDGVIINSQDPHLRHVWGYDSQIINIRKEQSCE